MKTKKEIDEATSFTVAFQMRGDSMYNDTKRGFADGDYLRCNEVSVQDMQVGSAYVIKIGCSHLVRQITSIEYGMITLSPLNPLYKESQIGIDDIQQVFLIKSYQRKVTDDVG